jgi:DNA polymerase epsilon subunit 1
MQPEVLHLVLLLLRGPCCRCCWCCICGCPLQAETLYKNHLLESETYIGGKVEALESGVFRADLPTRFKCKAAAYQGLIDNLDRDLGYAIQHDGGWELGDAENYEEVKAAITEKLEALRDAPNRWG